MNPGRASVGKGALAVLAIDEAAIFQVTQSEPDCNTADIKPAAKLMLARDGERCWIIPAKNFLREGSNQAGSGGGRALWMH